MKAVIIDDIESVAESIKLIIERYCTDVEIVGVAHSAESGKQKIIEYKPDLVLLDIQMPGGSGFDLLRSFEQIDFEVIFVTAYDEYAVKAIKFGALDYILKPIDIHDIRNAIERSKSKVDLKHAETRNFLNNMNNPNDPSNTLIINTEKGIVLVKISDIIHIESDGNYSVLFLINGNKLISSKNLKTYDNYLDSNMFVRIHHSHLINLFEIRELYNKNGMEVRMSNGDILPVSVRKKQDLLNHFNRF